MKNWRTFSYLINMDKSYADSLYKKFKINPESIDNSWENIFKNNNYYSSSGISKQEKKRKLNQIEDRIKEKQDFFKKDCFNKNKDKICQMITAFRSFGHFYSKIDPLGLQKNEKISCLDLSFYDFTKENLEEEFYSNTFINRSKKTNLKELYKTLKKIYCRNIGIEYMHIVNEKEKVWIQKYMESNSGKLNFDKKEKVRFLKDLISAEGIERYLNTKFPGAKRFSLEGSDVLIPMLKEIIYNSGKEGIQDIFLGMAHRGRLNVLFNIFKKNIQDIIEEFSGRWNKRKESGDVKYHQGFYSCLDINNYLIYITLLYNPSHLEIVNPVVMGLTRAHIDQNIENKKYKSLPIVIHGDAAIVGQGVVQETLNMSKVRSYEVGGTLHIVINNQIGFTTSEIFYARSSKYCTDIMKMTQSPILHVNADDVESAIFSTKLALDFRNTFKKDIIIDLVCYRRYGHNESDEPRATQPLMYKKIKNHPTVMDIYASYLKEQKIIDIDKLNKLVNNFRNSLEEINLKNKKIKKIRKKNFSKENSKNLIQNFRKKLSNQYLKEILYNISYIPKEIDMQFQVKKIYKNRIDIAQGKRKFDWGSAEMLSYATILDSGLSIRLTGQDTSRGTFFHRHAIVYDQNSGKCYVPLDKIRRNKSRFFVWDSVLSEEAVLAFEYGYSIAKTNTLVIWEAQFGDFVNGAQVVIDQFISSGEQKWKQKCNLVLMLPHGYEGQGPEHSSSRLERFLQLCAEKNMQICIPSNPAQIFSLIRRQAFSKTFKPLILLSPKSLLRHPLVQSSFDELAEDNFKNVIDEIDKIKVEKINRIILCTGKIYYDLLNRRRKDKKNNIAIIRIEQLYPFPFKEIKNILRKYVSLREIIWCQEEPKNQGAWNYFNYINFSKIIPSSLKIKYVGRKDSASPAVGDIFRHRVEQESLIFDAFN